MKYQCKICVVIPCYRVKNHVEDVINSIPSYVQKIYVVDDGCPDKSGDFIKSKALDQRVCIISHSTNQGVGAAVITGYLAALKDQMEIIVKIDGDGQMDPKLINQFISPIVHGEADYSKGNRFFYLDNINQMPKIRLFGNAALSLMSKVSSGYWNIFDPTNGYTAIHSDVLIKLPLDKVSRRYFFETDMLFRLNTIRAVVVDVPMEAKYGEEKSNLKISNIIAEFFFKHMYNFCRRIFYNYYLRDMSIASFELPLGVALLIFGLIYGTSHWLLAVQAGSVTPAGTVMLSALPVLAGIQFLMGFVAYDVASVPRRPIHKKCKI